MILLSSQLCVGQLRVPLTNESSAFTPNHLRQLKSRTEALFDHGWHSYIQFGFPADEVRPVSCEPYGPQFTDPENLHLDAMGNVSLTVIDNLDTLMIMGKWDELVFVLRYLEINQATVFAQDHVVQVFEASIRWLGGLLLAHLALTDNVLNKVNNLKFDRFASKYDGFLLRMAYDLGLRLIPAYNTSTSLPLPRINMAKGLKGVRSSQNIVGCTAGATTPLLEFSLLLRLTGDSRFEKLTRKTFWKLWSTRLETGLLPMTINPSENKWLDVVTGIGALIDSFYEYAAKASIVLQDNKLWRVFARSYDALMTHLAMFANKDSWLIFANVHVSSPERSNMWVDLLSAFWPGLQVLVGRLSDAVSTHMVFLKIWDHFDSIPERWEQISAVTETAPLANRVHAAISLEWYPLRPEFIESTYYLYRATRDPMYLQIGLRILTLFETQYKSVCGFTGFQDIRTGRKQNRMETFVLSELLKYLYLLFDEENTSYVHGPSMSRKNWVFSTEAHPLWYREEIGKLSRKNFEPFLSSADIQFKKFPGKGLLYSMWREIVSTLGGKTPLKKPKAVKANRVQIFGSELRPVAERHSFCETKPLQWTRSPEETFLSSGYCNWDHLFSLNNQLGSTLVRPEHLHEYSSNSVIELTPSFLNTHCLSGRLKSARLATTTEFDFAIGAPARPEEYEIYRVYDTESSYLFQKDDLVMPRFEGRIKLERLTNNSITRDNTLIENDYVRKFKKAVYWPERWEVFRIHTVNGNRLTSNNTLWTKGEALLESLDLFKISEEGYVSIDGRFIENFKAF